MKKRTMLRASNLYEEALRRLNDLKIVQRETEQMLKNAPEGKIHIIKSRRKMQFYLRTNPKDKSGKYLSKANKAVIQSYLQKSYDEKLLKLLKKEILLLEKFLKNSEQIKNSITNLYSDNSNEIKSYLNPVAKSKNDVISEWLSMDYNKKAIAKGTPVYKTQKGEFVRSKSELNIANELYRRGIPYKYECPLKLKSGVVVYPDFTVLIVQTEIEKYWEHRGMMDDRQYLVKSVGRIKEYSKNGIVIGDRLIITEETSMQPLGTNEIDAIINTLLIPKHTF